MEGQRIWLYALWYSGHILWTEFGHILVRWTHWSAQFAMDDWNRSHHNTQWQHYMRCMRIWWKRKAWFQAIGSWHPFAPVGSSNRDISCRRSGLHHHAYRQMVKWRASEIHLETSKTILKERVKTNYPVLLFSSNSGHCPTRDIKRRPPPVQPSWQCQEETQYWRQQVPLDVTPGLLPFQLTDQQCKSKLMEGALTSHPLKELGEERIEY